MTRSAVQHGIMNAPRGNQKIVFIAVAGALVFAALPFISKQACTVLLEGFSLSPQSMWYGALMH